MEVAELRERVGAILSQEEREPVDWVKVDQLTEELHARLAQEPDTDCPELVDHYLNDADIRARDDGYARRQRDQVRHFVETGEYVDSTPIPKWGCFLGVALIIALAVWVVL